MARTLLITETEDRGFALVYDGVRVLDQLGRDEATFAAAQFIVNGPIPYGGGVTADSYWTMRRMIEEELAAKLRPCDRLLLQSGARAG